MSVVARGVIYSPSLEAGRNRKSFPKKGSKPKPPRLPKRIDLQALCREHTALAVETLVANCRAGELGAANTAAATLLAYGYGRPMNNTNIRVIKDISELSDAELEAIAGAQVEAIADDTQEVEVSDDPENTTGT